MKTIVNDYTVEEFDTLPIVKLDKNIIFKGNVKDIPSETLKGLKSYSFSKNYCIICKL